MYHYGWLWKELTLLSEMYADVMDVIAAERISSPEILFLRLRRRSPRTLS